MVCLFVVAECMVGRSCSQDLNEFLPPVTIQWCHETLTAQQFSLPIIAGAANDEGDRTHYQTYKFLREAIRCHVVQKLEPHLLMSGRLSGAYTWQPVESATHNVHDMQFENEGPDLLMQEQDYEDIQASSTSLLFIILHLEHSI
jgi:hypothetical protein